MLKPSMEYKIETCISNDNVELENLLNTMSSQGWDVYSISEADTEDGDCSYTCIFAREAETKELDKEPIASIIGIKSKIERLMYAETEPLERCKSIQQKIRDKRQRISQIKSLIDETSENQRSMLNDEISKNIDELAVLQDKLTEIVSPDVMYQKIGQEKLVIKLSEELTDLVNPDAELNLLTKIVELRQNTVDLTGYIIPAVRFLSDDCLEANEYNINIRGVIGYTGKVFNGYKMFFKDELKLSEVPEYAIVDEDFYSQREVLWIPEDKSKNFWVKGLSAVETVARNLNFTVKKYINDLFDYNDLNNYIELVGNDNLYLIENIIPDFLSVAELKAVLCTLLKESVSIKDICYIFEKINDLSDDCPKEELINKLRLLLKRQISASIANENGTIQGFGFLSNRIDYLEEVLLKTKTDEEAIIMLSESKIGESIIKKIKNASQKYEIDITSFVLIIPLSLRNLTKLLLSDIMPNIRIVAQEEISDEFSVEILSRI